MSKIDRREFLKLVGAGGVGAYAGYMIAESIKHPAEYLIPYAVPPEEFSPGIATWYNTVCGMCPAGCGIVVRTREGRAKKIEGNPSHPVSQGRACALGQAGLQALYNPDRVTAPMMRDTGRGSASFAEISWNEALAAVGERLSALQQNGQGNRVVFLSDGVRGHVAELYELFMTQLGSDRLLYHDFEHPETLYAANQKLFGESALPYYDIRNTRYLLSFGADYLGSWLSPVHNGIGFGYSRQGRPNDRGHFVQVEPRMSISGAAADEWVPARPGTEGILALGIANQLVTSGAYNGTDSAQWTTALSSYTIDHVAQQTDVPAETIQRLADEFAHAKPALAIGGGAAGNGSNGVDTLIAVNALNHLAGNIGRTGGVVLNSAPAFGPAPNTQRASYQDFVSLIDDANQGKIDVLIVSGTNPVFTTPEAAGLLEALDKIPMIVSLSSFIDETTAMADVILPSNVYLESWGDDAPEPGVGFAIGSVSQPVVAPLYNTKPTGDILIALANQAGFGDAMPWPSMESFIKERWQALYAQSGTGDFDTFWHDVLRAGVWGQPTRRLARQTAPQSGAVAALGVEPPQFSGDSSSYPFVLHPFVSSTLRDGRGANLPWLQQLPDPMSTIVFGSWVEMNPATAKEMGLKEGDVVEVASPYGKLMAPLFIYEAIRPDVIAMPIGQGHSDYGRYARGRGSNPIQILAPETDADTGSLAWAATRVSIVPTGKRVDLVKRSGTSRELGRDIVQTTSAGAGGSSGHSAKLKDIPIRVVSS